MPNTITLRRPDDWHVHLRDGAMLKAGRAVHRAAVRARDRHANLVPPVTTVAAAAAYRERILAALPERAGFHAADDLLPDRRRRPGRDRARL